jgi:hypothetical protein
LSLPLLVIVDSRDNVFAIILPSCFSFVKYINVQFKYDVQDNLIYEDMWSKERMTRRGEGDSNLVPGWRPRLVVLFQLSRWRRWPRHRAAAATTMTTLAWGCGNDDGDLDMGLWRWQRRSWHAAAATTTMTLACCCSNDDADLGMGLQRRLPRQRAAATTTSARGCGDEYLGTGLRRRWCLDTGFGDENNADLDTGLWPALY